MSDGSAHAPVTRQSVKSFGISQCSAWTVSDAVRISTLVLSRRSTACTGILRCHLSEAHRFKVAMRVANCWLRGDIATVPCLRSCSCFWSASLVLCNYRLVSADSVSIQRSTLNAQHDPFIMYSTFHVRRPRAGRQHTMSVRVNRLFRSNLQ